MAKGTPSSSIKSKNFNIPTYWYSPWSLTWFNLKITPWKRSVPFENPSFSGIMLNSGGVINRLGTSRTIINSNILLPANGHPTAQAMWFVFSLSLVACREVFGWKSMGEFVFFSIQNATPLFRGKPWKMRGAVVEFSRQGKKWTRNSRQMIWRSQKYFLLIPIQTYLVVIYIDSYPTYTQKWDRNMRKET